MIDAMKCCTMCPRNCKADRSAGQKGYCGAGKEIYAAKAYLHKWEEPCISGADGSGTVFFSNCNLKCVFCQNYRISRNGLGKAVTISHLAEVFINLQHRGANNINLVTPTIYALDINEAVKIAKDKGLGIPVLYNTSGYEKTETLKELEGNIDVYLPDFKYASHDVSKRYSNAWDYFDYATKAIEEMLRQVGPPVFDDNGIIKKGLIIRHMVLPGHVEDSKLVLDWIAHHLPKDVYVSLMSQYTPYYNVRDYPEINRRLTKKEYDDVIEYFFNLGLKNGYMQESASAKDDYIPDFDFEGL